MSVVVSSPPGADAADGKAAGRATETDAPATGGGGLVRAFAKLFAGSAAGKALGVVREVAMAAAFGTGATAGAFRAGQTAALSLSHAVVGDALNSGFIPHCSELSRADPERARTLFWTLSLLLAGIGLVISVLMFTGAPVLSAWLVPGFSESTQVLTARMIRAMAFGVPMYLVGALFSYMGMANGRYVIASLRAPIYNVMLLLSVAAAFALDRPLLLGWGFTANALVFWTFGLTVLLKHGVLARPRRLDRSRAMDTVLEFARIVRPLMLIPVLIQANLVVERMVASLIGPDVVPALDYAKFFSESTLVLLAVPLGLAGLSELGSLSRDAARRTLERVLTVILFLAVALSLFLAVHGTPLVSVVLGRGHFGEDAVAVTSWILVGFAVGFWAQVSGYVLLKALSVQGRNREVLGITAAAAVTHVAANLVLFRFLGPLALGLSSGLAGLVLLTLSARCTGLVSVVSRVVPVLFAAGLAYLPMAWMLRGDGLVGLGLSGLFFLAFWVSVAYGVPHFRALLPHRHGSTYGARS